MKATIDIDEGLYRRLKMEAARRGRTVRELVAEGVRYVLDAPEATSRAATDVARASEWQPAWFGALARYGTAVEEHSMAAVRTSIAKGRQRERTP
jgi:plasmid stability protein